MGAIAEVAPEQAVEAAATMADANPATAGAAVGALVKLT